jgi:hypothetical protein
MLHTTHSLTHSAVAPQVVAVAPQATPQATMRYAAFNISKTDNFRVYMLSEYVTKFEQLDMFGNVAHVSFRVTSK